MNRIAISVATAVVVVLGVLHSLFGGLLVRLERSVIYSNELVSSGSDSSVAVLIGFVGFLVAFVGALLNKAILKTYFCSLIFLYVMLYLANLDVSLVGSIKLGDYALLISILAAHALGAYHLTSRSKFSS
ncbi:hypothetical protein [Arenicella xantha]|uniref:Uncharacterized protein n=1 Tax=Arenicella xantha TaxID=644221 RepID=A0A395JJV1_9GAMM|nr:hypothetical protein [Arenicella xantha]RBP45617.1 hypothetical protein DFR28_1186 [Arenicella xantha]